MIVDYFRKCLIESEINEREFLVRDLIDGTEKKMIISGKQRLWKNEYGLQKGKLVYIVNDKYKMQEKWRMLTQTDFKMNQRLFGLKIDIDNYLEGNK